MDLLVISSYPEKSSLHGTKTVGVGNYTKQTLLALQQAVPDANIKVMAEVLDEKEDYVENKIQVSRVWRRGNFLSQIKLFIDAAKSPQKLIILPFEVFMFGKFLSILLLMPLVLLLRLSGKKVVLVLHQVLGSDLSAFQPNPAKRALFKGFKGFFYAYLRAVCNKIIVFEQEFKHRLGNKDKVQVIPLAVINEPAVSKEVAREQLGLEKGKRYVFYFGYISPYKGLEELLSIWDPLENTQLIIGGGGNPNHMKDKKYQAFVQSIIDKAKEKDVLATGFIPENKMALYFSAVDIVVLPYKTFMSSSGPLAHAFSYGNGVLLSDQLTGYFNSSDMQAALAESQLSIDNVTFALDKPIKAKVQWAFHHIDKLQNFSNKMKVVRNWDLVGQEYAQEFREML